MNYISAIDIGITIGYFVLIIILSFVFRAKRFAHMFGEEKKPAWVLLAASLLMIEWSPMTDMMSMGLILEEGYSGLWLLKSRFWLVGVPAILYATMWARLKFKTDNELIRLRYSGKPGIALHVFRAIFLSLFVIPFFGAFIILALKKFLAVLNVGNTVSIDLILCCFVLAIVFKNSFHQKLRTDILSAVVCLIAPLLICYYLLQAHDPLKVYSVLNSEFHDQVILIPLFSESGKLGDFLVFICIQWWSINIVDNSDPNAQRHFQAKNQFYAFKALFFPIIISSLMFLAISTIWDYGLFEYKTYGYTGIDKEAFYLEIALKYLPDGLKSIAIIAIFFSFISTLESVINWGGGLLTVDIYKRYLFKNETDQHYKFVAFLFMLIVSLISIFFAYNNNQIISLQKFIFSISAGVAPVFLLRWFWWRINAWTQISSMVSSLIYTLTFDFFYSQNGLFSHYINLACHWTGLSLYPFKIIILTVAVVCTWLMVMYHTKSDDINHLKTFVELTGTGGIWPKSIPDQGYNIKKRIQLCLVFSGCYIMPFLFIWQFKFGESLIGIILLLFFVVSSIFVYRSMSNLVTPDSSK